MQSDTLKSRTATSSVALIRRALADLRAASTSLDSDENAFDEIVRSAETLSGGIKRLSVYASDVPKTAPIEPTEKSVDIQHVNRVLAALENGVCPKCGGLIE